MRERILLIVAALIIFIFAGTPVPAQENSYSIGFLFADGYSDANFKRIITDALDSISTDEGIGIDLRWFEEEKDFMEAVKNGELDIVYPNRHDTLPPLMTKYGYKAFMSLTVFASKDRQNPLCLFSKKDLKVGKTEDLRGLRMASYYTAEGYIFLRKMLGEKPDDFFSGIRPNRKGQQALDMIISGEADAAFVLRSNLLAMKKIKTTDSKKIDMIACVKDFYDLPFLYSESAPESLVISMRNLLLNADKSETFKAFWPMMRNFGLKFIPVSSDRYDNMIAVYAEAEKEGWMDDFNKWLASVEE